MLSPENVDAVRALMGLEDDWRASVDTTDSSIAALFGLMPIMPIPPEG